MNALKIPQFVVIKNVSTFQEVIDVRRSVYKDLYAMKVVIVQVCTV